MSGHTGKSRTVLPKVGGLAQCCLFHTHGKLLTSEGVSSSIDHNAVHQPLQSSQWTLIYYESCFVLLEQSFGMLC